MARDAGSGVDTLVVSGDSRLLAFVGPSKYVVTVMEACSLDEVPSRLPLLLGTGVSPGNSTGNIQGSGSGHGAPAGSELPVFPSVNRNNKFKVSSLCGFIPL